MSVTTSFLQSCFKIGVKKLDRYYCCESIITQKINCLGQVRFRQGEDPAHLIHWPWTIFQCTQCSLQSLIYEAFKKPCNSSRQTSFLSVSNNAFSVIPHLSHLLYVLWIFNKDGIFVAPFRDPKVHFINASLNTVSSCHNHYVFLLEFPSYFYLIKPFHAIKVGALEYWSFILHTLLIFRSRAEHYETLQKTFNHVLLLYMSSTISSVTRFRAVSNQQNAACLW